MKRLNKTFLFSLTSQDIGGVSGVTSKPPINSFDPQTNMQLVHSEQFKTAGTIEGIRINIKKDNVIETVAPTARPLEDDAAIDKKIESGMSKLKLAQKYKLNLQQPTTERVELKELGQ